MKTTSKPRSKPARFVKVVSTAGPWFLLEITEKTPSTEKHDFYLAAPIRGCTFGQGFQVEKQDAEGTCKTYHVCLNSRESSCECRGFINHGHCRHVEALSALAKAGELPALPVANVASVVCDPF